MYEVFINKSRVYPGIDPPESDDCKTLRLSLDTDPMHILSALKELLSLDFPQCLCLGNRGEDKPAWALLRSLLREEIAMGGLVWHKKKGLLMIRRLGFWDFPKGKPHPGEHPAETAIREVEEECGISSLNCGALFGRTYHIFQKKGSLFLKQSQWYLMHSEAEEVLIPQYEEGITDVRWMQYTDYLRIREELYPSLLSLAEKGWKLFNTPQIL